MAELTGAIASGDRFALSKAITIIESEKEEDQVLAGEIITAIQNKSGGSLRIGISGSPGVGKSTLIETLGMFILGKGKKPAILAVDPSSNASSGSILGDKTRMQFLSQSENAFIRPSAAGKTLGGVARKTRESILLLETANYNPVIIETVGVGQSETAVKSMTDLFVLVIAPGGGDEIQGIKRGIMELADIIVINKMDGTFKYQARETLQHYVNTVHLLQLKPHGIRTPVIGVSSIEKSGIDTLWDVIQDFNHQFKASGFITQNRRQQDLNWFEDFIRKGWNEYLFAVPDIKDQFDRLKAKVETGEVAPFLAAKDFLTQIKKRFKA